MVNKLRNKTAGKKLTKIQLKEGYKIKGLWRPDGSLSSTVPKSQGQNRKGLSSKSLESVLVPTYVQCLGEKKALN